MLRIAHIAPDEKFIDSAVDIFELAYPGSNDFFITTPQPWRHLKAKNNYKNLTKKKLLEFLIFKRKEFKCYDVVILHSLSNNYLIPMAFVKSNYVWLGWGFDYYSRDFMPSLIDLSSILPKTEQYFKEDAVHSKKTIINKLLGSRKFFSFAIRNLKIFSPVLPEEFILVKKKYNLKNDLIYSPWNYGILEKHWAKNIETDGIENANSILLGNSATSTNNHIEAIDIIIKSGTERDIYIPLSYGNLDYAKSVKEYIKTETKLDDKCYLLEDFIPLDKYNAIINACGFVIMNHVRQQAIGNIIAMLYRGCKVFLRKESISYSFFKSIDAKIYSVQDLERNPKLLDRKLSLENIEHNRKVLASVWSEEILLERTKMLVEKAMS